MAKRKRKRENPLSPAIIALNIAIVVVIALMVLFVYLFWTSGDTEPAERTTPPMPVTSGRATYTTTTTPAAVTESTTTSSYIPITQASTTTPVSVTPPPPDADPDAEAPEPIAPIGSYDVSFFENDLFVGDSIMTGMSGFGYLPPANVFAQIGLNPDSVFTTDINGRTLKQKLAEARPQRVFIMLGTNGLAFLSAAHMAEKMGALVTDIRSDSADTLIYILTIPPVTAAHDRDKPEKNADVLAYNALLTALDSDSVRVLDVYSQLKDKDGFLSERFAEEDGLHFLGAAYKAVLSYIQSELS